MRVCVTKNNFSDTGNLGFGVQEHTDLGIKYEPSIGVCGLDFGVVLGRPGFSIIEEKDNTGCTGAKFRATKRRPRAGSSRGRVGSSFLFCTESQ